MNRKRKVCRSTRSGRFCWKKNCAAFKTALVAVRKWTGKQQAFLFVK